YGPIYRCISGDGVVGFSGKRGSSCPEFEVPAVGCLTAGGIGELGKGAGGSLIDPVNFARTGGVVAGAEYENLSRERTESSGSDGDAGGMLYLCLGDDFGCLSCPPGRKDPARRLRHDQGAAIFPRILWSDANRS